MVRAVHVLLIPLALLPHRGHGEFGFGNQFIQRLRLPEAIIAGVVLDVVPEGQLLHAAGTREFPAVPASRKFV